MASKTKLKTKLKKAQKGGVDYEKYIDYSEESIIKDTNDLILNFVVDLKKKEISKLQRARLIQKLLKDSGTGIRELARRTGIPLSTLHTWISFGRIDDNEYKELIAKGYTEAEIERKLVRKEGDPEDENFYKLMDKPLINIETQRAINKLEKFITNKFDFDKETGELLKKLKDKVDRILRKIGED